MVRTTYTGPVSCTGRVENALGSARVVNGERKGSVQSVHFTEAVVTSGPIFLGLPSSVLDRLGRDGLVASRWSGPTRYGPIRLWIGDRDLALDAMEVGDDSPVLIGQIALGHLQYIVDVPNHRLTPSPANGGQWILDAF